MPPEGYETVTLPTELVAQIDSHANAIGAESRSQAIQSLFDGVDTRASSHVVSVDSGVLNDISNTLADDIATELEARSQ